jgi:hypothetical protein
MQTAGVTLCWFFADALLARESFSRRSPNEIANFDAQMQRISPAGYPNGLNSIEIESLTAEGFKDWRDLWEIIRRQVERRMSISPPWSTS